MQKRIAFFDFDGTITTKDTMLELARFSCGNTAYWFGVCIISPWLIAMKLKFLSKTSAKEKLLTYFFGNMPTETFNNICISFIEKKMPTLIMQDALNAIKKHQSQSTTVVVVSASAQNWVAPWCIKNNIQCICSHLLIAHNKITGKLDGKNCNGNEKVNRIKELFNLNDYETIYCYGDTSGDKEMLQLATHAHYRIFKK